ncbi:unnamed protein product, partial [Didymodactylos carnosus]
FYELPLETEVGFDNWSSSVVNLNDLKNNIVSYLVQIGVISRFNQGSYEISECNLILNRLQRYVDIEKPYLKICPLHRYTFGIGWKDQTYCQHIDHKNSSDIPGKKRKRKQYSTSNNRVAPIHLVQHLARFPYGGRLCAFHLKEVYSTIQLRQSTADELNAISGVHSYEGEVNNNLELNDTNILLMSLDQSPLKSEASVPLEEQAPGSIRRLTRKLRRAVSVAAANFAESIAPGQGKKLLQLAHLNNLAERPSLNVSTSSNTSIDEQYLSYLIQMYQAYEEKNLPFNEQVRVLSLIPKSWKLTSKMIEEKFNCTSYAVKTARRLYNMTDIPLHIEEKIPKSRQRLDPRKIDYFISWITQSDLLISIPWGNTNLKLENGEKISIPRQMLQAQKSQVIHLYKQHCNELGILTRQDFDLYYHGERCTSDQPQSLTCPFCGEMGFGFPYLDELSSSNNSTQNVDLFQHLQTKHADDQQSQEVICPICAAMINGEPNLVTADLISHIANDHQYSPVDTPSSAGDGTNPYSRQSSSATDYDFGIGAGIRGGFRRGSLRTPGR